MNIQPNLGHSTNQTPIGQKSDVYTGELDLIQDTSEKILRVLGEEDRMNIRLYHKQFNKLFKQFILEIEKLHIKSTQSNYGIADYKIYGFDPYHNRLSQDEQNKILVFNRILDKNKKIKLLISKILNLFPLELQNIFLSKLRDEYFDDLIYEFMDIKEMTNDSLKRFITEHSLEQYCNGDLQFSEIFFKSRHFEFFNIEFGYFCNKYPNEMMEFFMYFEQINVISLKNCSFAQLGKGWLAIIFGHLKKVKSIIMPSIELYLFDEETLNIIFGNLSELKYLNLGDNRLQSFSDNVLRIIFGNLKRLKFYENGSTSNLQYNNFSDSQYGLISSLLGDKVLTNL